MDAARSDNFSPADLGEFRKCAIGVLAQIIRNFALAIVSDHHRRPVLQALTKGGALM